MDATELRMPDGAGAGVWMCGECRTLSGWCHAPVRTGDRDTTPAAKDEFARARAERCCGHRCEKCGQPSRPHHRLCDRCDAERALVAEHDRERKRFDAATKLTPEEREADEGAGTWLYCALRDRWFDGLDDVEEYLSCDDERTRPEYLWLTRPIRWQPDLSGYVTNHVHDNFHEDAVDQLSAEALNELDEFAKQWWLKNGVTSYEPDYTRCVVLPPVAVEG